MNSFNKQPAQDPFTMLPPEILSLVCGFLQKRVLKRVRQISKIWDQAAIPHLFNEIFISQDVTDFHIAKLVIHHFRHYIRTLVFSSLYYRDVISRHFGIDDDTNHSDYAFTLYHIMCNKQQETLAYLSFALTSLPNIRKIILTDTFSSRLMPHQSLQVYQPRKLKACPFEDCDLTPVDHLDGFVRETGFLKKDSTNPWRLVLSALSTTKANVRELTMEPDEMCLGTDSAAFSMSPWGLSQAILSFRNLTKLRLSLIDDTEYFMPGVDTCHVFRNVAKLLGNAINLESLSLDISSDGDPPTSSSLFQEILGQCKFPKLRSLILAFFTSSDEELLRLLSHSKRLEQITINCFTLATGSWMRIADWIRASLPLLKHAELAHLYGGFDNTIDEDGYLDLYGDVGNFLFASGENPFTKNALEKYLADKAARRQAPDVAVWQGYIGAYTKYH